MTTKLRLGLIGAGRISGAYVDAARGLECARIVGVADVRADAAASRARDLDCPAFSSPEALADAVRPDAVVVCTPPVTHASVASFFLERGVHVLCEKPFAMDSTSARAVVEAARRSGSIVTMASKFRYVEDVARARDIVRSGVLGELTLYENSFTAKVDMAGRWNADPAISGGGVLIDNGSHSVDILRYFLGPIVEIKAWEGRRSQGLPVEETVRVFLRTAGDVLGYVDLSWSIAKNSPSYIEVYGDRGVLSVGWKESRYRLFGSDDWVVFGRGYDKVEAFQRQLRNFCRAVRGEEELVITADDALASVDVIETAYAALQLEKWTVVRKSPRVEEGAAA
jgi:predicted dehydrogenase